MRKIETYYKGSGDFVEAYEKKDLEELAPFFEQAEIIWYNEWVKQGKEDIGTCCGGKSIQVWYVAPRCRSATPKKVVASPPVQGNISAQRSNKPALDFLKANNIKASYYDGWMD